MCQKILVVLLLLYTDCLVAQPLPTPAQMAWQNAELGVLISYDLHVFDGKRYNQSYNRITPIPDYNIFNPEKLNTDSSY